MNKEFLRNLPLFAELSDGDLEWLSQQAKPVSIKTGEFLITEGAPGDSAYIVVDGEFEIVKKSDQRDIVIAVRDAGAVIGEMALIDNAPRIASVRAVKDGNLLKISDQVFYQLLQNSAVAVLAILRTVSARLRQNEAMLRQSEKMAALGTLSAGLAHELNNPAAAAHRSADQLRSSLAEWQNLASELDRLSFNDLQLQKIDELRNEMSKRHSNVDTLDPMAQSDRENDIQKWLEEKNVAQAWEIAPVLVSAGMDINTLLELCASYSPQQLVLVTKWLAIGYTVFSLLDEVSMSAERISEIVKSVKEYSYLEQAPVQQVDIQASLDNTLVILRHKTKDGIKNTKEYAADFPLIEAFGSELNQVWTNILDNAIDALDGKGEIVLRTYAKGENIFVEIQDNSPGIPPQVQKRIFELFFTTKPPGVGTGLGLHISYTIVHNHYGQIRVTSRPGQTCFQIRLPIQMPRPKG